MADEPKDARLLTKERLSHFYLTLAERDDLAERVRELEEVLRDLDSVINFALPYAGTVDGAEKLNPAIERARAALAKAESR